MNMKTRKGKLISLDWYTPSGDYQEFKVVDANFEVPPATRPPTSFCVAVAVTGKGVAIRSSRDTKKTTIFFDHKEWAVFLDGIRKGHFQPPGGVDVNLP